MELSMEEVNLTSAKKLFEAMSAMGIDEIEAHYQGYGDNFDGIEIEPHSISNTLKSLAADAVSALVDHFYPGFENNSGGGGDITFDATERVVRIRHYWSVEEMDEEFATITPEDDEELAKIMATLPNQGKGTALIEGYGDSGQLEQIDPIIQSMEDWMLSKLDELLPGWENNNGGGAEFTVDLNNQEVNVRYWYNYEDQKEEEEIVINWCAACT